MKFDKDKYPTYKIISKGMMSIPTIGEGRLIPCIIIDKEIAQDVFELTKIHENSPPGDIETTWTTPFTLKKAKVFILKFKFSNPMEIIFGVAFNIYDDTDLIDAIISSQTIHFETGIAGDKVSDLKNKGILVEVPRTDFGKTWEKHLLDVTIEKYKRAGIPKSERKELARAHIKTTREIWNIRRK